MHEATEAARETTLMFMKLLKEEEEKTKKAEARITALESDLLKQVQITLGFCTQRNDALDLYDELKAESEVRPMNKAPKDGTEILGRTLSENGKCCIWFVVWWSDKARGWWSYHGDLWSPDGWIPCPPSTKS